MEHESGYFWVVLCKNRIYHYFQHRSVRHPILLGETDSVSPPPLLPASFRARCDECGREYKYRPGQLLRFETDPPAEFVAHALFFEVIPQ
jgi:hypothetical protein